MDNDYQIEAGLIKLKYENLTKTLNQVQGKIIHLKNILDHRPNLTEEDRRTFVEEKNAEETRLIQISKDVRNYEFYTSPLPTDGAAERQARRIRKWHWRYYYCPKDDNFIKLRIRLPRAYTQYKNTEAFNISTKSFNEFVMDFFRMVARTHEEVSQVVHATAKIEAKDEFLLIEILEFFRERF